MSNGGRGMWHGGVSGSRIRPLSDDIRGRELRERGVVGAVESVGDQVRITMTRAQFDKLMRQIPAPRAGSTHRESFVGPEGQQLLAGGGFGGFDSDALGGGTGGSA